MESEQNHVPEGWISARIDEIVEVNPGKPPKDLLPSDAPVSFVPMPAVDAEQGAIIEPEVRPYHKVRSGYTAFRNDDLIVAKITPCMENGKAAVARDLVNGLGFGSSEFHVLRSHGTVLPEYLYHFVRQQSFRDDAAKQMTGSVGQKRVPADFIKSSVIPLPPLPEQRRIVVQLEALLADCERVRGRLEAVAATMQRFRQAVLGAAYDGQLTEAKKISVDSLTSRRATARDDDTTSKWNFVKINDIGEVVRGASPRPAGDPRFFGGEVPWITVGELTKDNSPYLVSVPLSLTREGQQHSRTISSGTFLLTNSGVTLGVPKISCIEGCINDGIAAILNLNGVSKLFLYYYLTLQTPKLRAINQGMAQPNLNTSIIKDIKIPLPPLTEQHEIVRRVEALFALADRIEGEVAGALGRVEALTQAVLAKAFRGELVPTEAELARREGREYDPAGVLLEQVRAGREDGRKEPATRGRRRSGQATLPVGE